MDIIMNLPPNEWSIRSEKKRGTVRCEGEAAALTLVVIRASVPNASRCVWGEVGRGREKFLCDFQFVPHFY